MCAIVIFCFAPEPSLQKRDMQQTEKLRPHRIHTCCRLTQLRLAEDFEWHLPARLWRCGVGRDCGHLNSRHVAHSCLKLFEIGRPPAPVCVRVLRQRNPDRDHIVWVIAEWHMQKTLKTLNSCTCPGKQQ